MKQKDLYEDNTAPEAFVIKFSRFGTMVEGSERDKIAATKAIFCGFG